MNNDLIYVYCISNKLPDFRKNKEFEGLSCISFQGFYVVVKMVPESEFSEENLKKNLSDISWVDTNARSHIGIIGLLMEYSTVIPFRFGTIYNTREGLKEFVRDYSESLMGNFERIEGCEEWAVKIYCNRKALSEQIDDLSIEASDLEKQIMASSPGKAFLLRRKKTDLIENEVNRLTKTYGQEFYDEINKLCEASALNNLLPKELTGRDDMMILNVAFLVRKNKVDEFSAAIKSLKLKYNELGFDIELTGPWPPFSFIMIKEQI